MKLSPTAGHPYQALAAAVLAKIQRGDLKPDDRLPPIRTLAKDYGVTIATAQRAVQQLAHEGHVKSVANLGSFVLPPSAGGVTSVTVEEVNQRVRDLQTVMAKFDQRLRRLEGPSATDGEQPSS